MSESPTVAVIGSGSWGTAVAGLAAQRARSVRLWCRSAEVADAINATRKNPRHLPSFELPANVTATADAHDALAGASAAILVLPSAHLRRVCALIAPSLADDADVLVLTKGVEPKTNKLMLEVAADELGHPERIAVLSGPNHAEEISEGKVSAAVCAAKDPELAGRFRDLLVSPSFRVYVSDDVEGVEVCAAAKNVIAIACGIAAAMGAGDNALAALMTRGIAEIARLAAALGANPLTPMGLAGMGDLVATCTSRHSRNRTFGEAFAAGETLAEYEERTGMVVEGARAATSVLTLAQSHGVEVPITRAVHALLANEVPLSGAMNMLLGRTPGEEFYGIDPLEKETPHA